MNQNSNIISNPNTEYEALVEAISTLKNGYEKPMFWSNIINNEKYNLKHRSLALYQFFKRHVRQGMNLKELAQILNHPFWLNLQDIILVTEISGEMPVQFSLENTVIQLRVFPGVFENNWAVYLLIEDKITIEEFYNVLRQNVKYKNSDFNSLRILEVGLSPDNIKLIN